MGKLKKKGKQPVNVLKKTKNAEQSSVTKEKKFRSPYLDYEYEEVVEFTCPVRGKVKQKVMIKRLKTQLEPATRHVVPSVLSPVDAVEQENGGISLSELEEAEETGTVDTLTGAESSED